MKRIDQRLKARIKSEEKTLFPCAQELLTEAGLDAIGATLQAGAD